MTKIEWVSADYDDTLPVFGAAVIIHLNTGHTIFFSLESKAGDPEYAVLYDDKRLFSVETDGESIYWRNGPRIVLEEIFALMRANNKNAKEI